MRQLHRYVCDDDDADDDGADDEDDDDDDDSDDGDGIEWFFFRLPIFLSVPRT